MTNCTNPPADDGFTNSGLPPALTPSQEKRYRKKVALVRERQKRIEKGAEKLLGVLDEIKDARCVGDSPIRPVRLSERERAILELILQGLTNKLIGKRLGITDGTVNGCIDRVSDRLEIPDEAPSEKRKRHVVAKRALDQDTELKAKKRGDS